MFTVWAVSSYHKVSPLKIPGGSRVVSVGLTKLEGCASCSFLTGQGGVMWA